MVEWKTILLHNGSVPVRLLLVDAGGDKVGSDGMAAAPRAGVQVFLCIIVPGGIVRICRRRGRVCEGGMEAKDGIGI